MEILVDLMPRKWQVFRADTPAQQEPEIDFSCLLALRQAYISPITTYEPSRAIEKCQEGLLVIAVSHGLCTCSIKYNNYV